MGSILTTKLREDGLTLRSIANSKTASKSSLVVAKLRMMKEVHAVLTLMLGPPPKPDAKFDWEFYDAVGKYRKVSKTPLELAKELSAPSLVRTLNANVNELFSLVNDPRNKYNQLLTVDRLGNVIGGRPITYVNVDMDTMKKAAISMLQAGLPIFFGSDVGKFSNPTSGIMDTALYDYGLAFNISLNMSKSQRLKARESAMTHAMVLTAVQVEDGRSIRWRVQNSWGEAAGEKGWFVMSDTWMDEFVYQVVVDPSFVGKEIRDVLDSKPLTLPLWDPMGALA
jgi:bleomycin hydrolase